MILPQLEEGIQPFVYLGPGHPTLYYPQRAHQERRGASFLQQLLHLNVKVAVDFLPVFIF